MRITSALPPAPPRLPIVQGGTHGFLGPILAILSLMPCPSPEEFDALTEEEKTELWQVRMRQVQGAICVSAVFQILVGFTGESASVLPLATNVPAMTRVRMRARVYVYSPKWPTKGPSIDSFSDWREFLMICFDLFSIY